MNEKWETTIEMIDDIIMGVTQSAIQQCLDRFSASRQKPDPSPMSSLGSYKNGRTLASSMATCEQRPQPGVSSFTARLSKPAGKARSIQLQPESQVATDVQADHTFPRNPVAELQGTELTQAEFQHHAAGYNAMQASPSCGAIYAPAEIAEDNTGVQVPTESRLKDRLGNQPAASATSGREGDQAAQDGLSPKARGRIASSKDNTSQSQIIPLTCLLQTWSNPCFGFAQTAVTVKEMLAVSSVRLRKELYWQTLG